MTIKSEYNKYIHNLMNYIQSKYKYKLKIFSMYNITYKITLRKKYYSYDSFFLNIFTLI